MATKHMSNELYLAAWVKRGHAPAEWRLGTGATNSTWGTVILIGADISLVPFDGRNSLDTDWHTFLEVLPKEFVLSYRSAVQRATPIDLSYQFEKNMGKAFLSPTLQASRAILNTSFFWRMQQKGLVAFPKKWLAKINEWTRLLRSTREIDRKFTTFVIQF